MTNAPPNYFRFIFFHDPLFRHNILNMLGGILNKYDSNGTMVTFYNFMKIFGIWKGSQQSWDYYMSQVYGLDALLMRVVL